MQGVASVVQIFLLPCAIPTKVIDVLEIGKVDPAMIREPNFSILNCSQFRIIYNDREKYKSQNSTRPAFPMIGKTLDEKYSIERELGGGGMGTVYLATHLGTERPVAIKVISPQYMERAEFV